MALEEVFIAVRVSAEMDRELGKLSEKFGASKSELIRQAITSLIGMYKNAVEKASKV